MIETDETRLTPDAQKTARAFPHNAAVAIMFDCFWCLGAPFVLLYTVIPSYLLNLGASKMLVQCVTISLTVLSFLQFWSGRLFDTPRRKIGQAFIWGCYPAFWIIYGVLALAFWHALPIWFWITLFVGMCMPLFIILHLASPAYTEMLLQNTPLNRRGRLASMRSIAVGLFGFIGAFMAGACMKRWPAPFNYHHCFVIGAMFMAVSCLALVFFKDVGWQADPARPRGQLRRDARALFGNINFRTFLVFFTMTTVSLSFSPLLIGYGRDTLHMLDDATIKFTTAYFAGTIAVGAFIPLLADHFGFKLIGIISSILLALAYLLPLTIPHSTWALLAAYALLSGSLNLNNMVLANLGSELAPGVKTSTIVAMGTILVLPISLWIAPLGGRLVDVFGPAGYMTVFVMGVTLALCALLGFAAVIREPRSGQELYVRMREL